MNMTTTLPGIACEFLALPHMQQQELSPNGFYDFSDHGRWVPITDYYRSTDAFHREKVTVHTLNTHRRPASKTGVPLTPDYRLLLTSSAQYLSGIYVVHAHDTISHIDMPDGSTLTGLGGRAPWRQPLPCVCAWCESQKD